MKINFLSEPFAVLIPPIIPTIRVTTPITRKNMETKKAPTNTIGRKIDRYTKDGGSIKTKYTRKHKMLKQAIDTSRFTFQFLIIDNIFLSNSNYH